MDAIAQLILERIPVEPERVSTTELIAVVCAAGRGIGPRGFQKRLKSIRDRYDIVCNDRVKPHLWSWVSKAKKQRALEQMTPPQAMALALAAEHLRPLLPPPALRWVEERVEEARGYLDREATGRPRSWRNKVKRVPHEVPRLVPVADAKVFAAVSEALYDGTALALRYRKRFSDDEIDYEVQPLGLLDRSGELWLVARKIVEREPGDVHQFLLHRMSSARKLQGVSVPAPANFSLDREIADGKAHFQLALGSQMPLVARFHDDVVDKLIEAPLGADQRVVRADTAWHRLRVTVAHTRALEAFLLGYGPLCVVEAPEPLRERFAKLHAQAARLYTSR